MTNLSLGWAFSGDIVQSIKDLLFKQKDLCNAKNPYTELDVVVSACQPRAGEERNRFLKFVASEL